MSVHLSSCFNLIKQSTCNEFWFKVSVGVAVTIAVSFIVSSLIFIVRHTWRGLKSLSGCDDQTEESESKRHELAGAGSSRDVEHEYPIVRWNIYKSEHSELGQIYKLTGFNSRYYIQKDVLTGILEEFGVNVHIYQERGLSTVDYTGMTFEDVDSINPREFSLGREDKYELGADNIRKILRRFKEATEGDIILNNTLDRTLVRMLRDHSLKVIIVNTRGMPLFFQRIPFTILDASDFGVPEHQLVVEVQHE